MSELPHRPWIPLDAEPKARALHARILRQDVTAPSEMAEFVLTFMIQGIRRGWPRAEEHDLLDACHEAFMAYLLQPERYNPSRGGVVAYLIMAAKGDMKNLAARRARRDHRVAEVPDSVAEEGMGWEELAEFGRVASAEEVGLLNLEQAEITARVARYLPEPLDEQFFEMILNGVRETALFALLLGIDDLPVENQRLEVKRRRDRILVSLKRHRNELFPEHARSTDD